MTCCVHVMNIQGAALAADSASGGEGKGGVLSTFANKIHQLSPDLPLGTIHAGVPVYGHIPLETVMGEFGDVIGDKALPTVEAYAKRFVVFLRQQPFPIPEHVEPLECLEFLRHILQEVRNAYDLNDVHRHLLEEQDSERAASVLLEAASLGVLDGVRQHRKLRGHPGATKKLKSILKGDLPGLLEEVFPGIQITPKHRRILTELSVEALTREAPGPRDFEILAQLRAARRGWTDRFPTPRPSSRSLCRRA